jgi:superfamily II DNA/RNA helicase
MACAPTGSGKTLAYLFPLFCKIKSIKKSGIKAIILAPTRELVNQVERFKFLLVFRFLRLKSVFKFSFFILNKKKTKIFLESLRVGERTSIKVDCITNVTKKKLYTKSYEKKYDILISTPHKLINLLEQENFKASFKR